MKKEYNAPDACVCMLAKEDIMTLSATEKAMGVEVDCSEWI